MILLATSWQALFSGTVLGFIASALLVVSVALPSGAKSEKRRGVYDRARVGFRIFMATPRLRGVMSLNLVVSLAGAMVVVNTVVLVLLGLALGVLILALKLWPSVDSSECWHNHNDLPGDHPHVANASSSGAHRHNYVIDSLHPKWPD